MRFLPITLFLLASPAAAVAYSYSIPSECLELAQREGVPAVIENRYQASKAKVKLSRLSSADPLVRECRAAVERHRRAAVNN